MHIIPYFYMKIKEKKLPFVVLGSVILILYLLFSNLPLKKEIQLLPQWTVDLKSKYESLGPSSNDESLNFLTDGSLPFIQGNYLGRLYPDGTIAFIEHFSELATISNLYWAAYPYDAKNAVIHSMDNKESFLIAEEGFPFAIDDFLCSFFPGGNAFGFYDTEGNLLWEASHWSPLTAFSVSKEGIVVGYVDGNLRLFSIDGKLLFSTYPAGSQYEVIYGAAISSDSSLLAAISGLDKQRFVLYALDGENSKIIFHEYLENQDIRERFMRFNTEKTKVYYETKGGLVAFSISEKKSEFMKLPGKICGMQELRFEKLLSVLSEENGLWYLTLLDDFNEIIAQFSFEAKTASLFSNQNGIYLGHDDFISKMEIVRK